MSWWPPSLVFLLGHSVCEEGLFQVHLQVPYSTHFLMMDLTELLGGVQWLQVFVSIPWLFNDTGLHSCDLHVLKCKTTSTSWLELCLLHVTDQLLCLLLPLLHLPLLPPSLMMTFYFTKKVKDISSSFTPMPIQKASSPCSHTSTLFSH